jgi:hypothetical protein
MKSCRPGYVPQRASRINHVLTMNSVGSALSCRISHFGHFSTAFWRQQAYGREAAPGATGALRGPSDQKWDTCIREWAAGWPWVENGWAWR